MRHTNKDLQHWFEIANQRYFDNRIPSHTVVRYKDIPGRLGRSGRRHITRKPTKSELKTRPNCVSVIEPSFIILIDIRLRSTSCYSILTLLHEMVHCAHWKRKGHGKRFDREMLKLAKRGAFDGLW